MLANPTVDGSFTQIVPSPLAFDPLKAVCFELTIVEDAAHGTLSNATGAASIFVMIEHYHVDRTYPQRVWHSLPLGRSSG
jgi:hypothetical protein